MTRLFPLSLLALSLAACGGGDDNDTNTNSSNTNNNNNNTSSATVAQDTNVTIKVTEPDGTPISGATLSVAGKGSMMTNTSGQASLVIESGYSGFVDVAKDTHLRQQVKVDTFSTGGNSTFTAVMKPIAFTQEDVNLSAAGSTPVTITEPSSKARVEFEVDDPFIDKDGANYSGLVDVSITPIDVTDDDEIDAFPGEFRGIIQNGTVPTEIVSYGVADFTFKDQNGDVLQLKDGVEVEIDLPVFQTGAIAGLAAPVAGAKIPMWYYDYDDNVWKQNEVGDGQGTVVDVGGTLMLRGDVNHFTPWNVDDFPQTANLTTNITCGNPANNQAATNARVEYRAAGRVGIRNLTSTSTGKIPVGGQACATVLQAYCGGIAQAQQTQCVTASQADQNLSITFSYQ